MDDGGANSENVIEYLIIQNEFAQLLTIYFYIHL